MIDDQAYIDSLKRAVESLHKCKAQHLGSEAIRDYYRDELVWDGRVEFFGLTGHSKAQMAYAWSYQDEGEFKYVAFLEIPPIVSARNAVRVAIASGRL
jgi:hypothetical protein